MDTLTGSFLNDMADEHPSRVKGALPHSPRSAILKGEFHELPGRQGILRSPFK
jgi:hypothetical protein